VKDLEGRRLSLRVEPDGSHGVPVGPPDPSWLRADTDRRARCCGWSAPARQARSRRWCLSAPPDARQHAALGLTGALRVRAVALAARDRIEPAIRTDPLASADFAVSGGRRAGIGMAVSIDGLPVSWAAARTALRLAADGTKDDPGPRSVRYDELGGLALLAENVTSVAPVIPDELALEHAAVAAPWMLATLHAVATSACWAGPSGNSTAATGSTWPSPCAASAATRRVPEGASA
jgi:hypothetical protein